MDQQLSKGRKNQRKNPKNGKQLEKGVSDAQLKGKLDAKDCFFGVLDTKKFSGFTVKCSKFSVIFKIKKKFIALFVTEKFIFLLDANNILRTKSLPTQIFQFINSLSNGRKIITTKFKSTVKSVIKTCFKFLIYLYKRISIDTVISLLNLILV